MGAGLEINLVTEEIEFYPTESRKTGPLVRLPRLFTQPAAKGSLLSSTGTAFSALGVGSDGQFLKADSTAPSGLAWGAAAGGASDHGALTGLEDDDHPQYLLASGTRPLTGNWALGAFNLSSTGTINNAVGSTTALRVRNASNADTLVVDTTNRRLGVNVAPTLGAIHLVRPAGPGSLMYLTDGTNVFQVISSGTPTISATPFLLDCASVNASGAVAGDTVNGNTVTAATQFWTNNSSTTALNIQTTILGKVLIADTTNNRVGVGMAPTGTERLQVSGTTELGGNTNITGTLTTKNGAGTGTIATNTDGRMLIYGGTAGKDTYLAGDTITNSMRFNVSGGEALMGAPSANHMRFNVPSGYVYRFNVNWGIVGTIAETYAQFAGLIGFSMSAGNTVGEGLRVQRGNSAGPGGPGLGAQLNWNLETSTEGQYRTFASWETVATDSGLTTFGAYTRFRCSHNGGYNNNLLVLSPSEVGGNGGVGVNRAYGSITHTLDVNGSARVAQAVELNSDKGSNNFAVHGNASDNLIGTVAASNAIRFFNGAGASKQTVSGSRAGNAALASLLTALAAYGLITDSSSA